MCDKVRITAAPQDPLEHICTETNFFRFFVIKAQERVQLKLSWADTFENVLKSSVVLLKKKNTQSGYLYLVCFMLLNSPSKLFIG